MVMDIWIRVLGLRCLVFSLSALPGMLECGAG
jgi:hypothetical protein